jgi:hypothetical protein
MSEALRSQEPEVAAGMPLFAFGEMAWRKPIWGMPETPRHPLVVPKTFEEPIT